MQGCERGIGAHLIHEHQEASCVVEGLGDQHTPGRSQELQFALTRTQSPFFRMNPIRFNSRETVDSLTLTPQTLSRNCIAFLRAWRGRVLLQVSLQQPSCVLVCLGLGAGPLFLGAASGRPWWAILA